MTAEEPVSSELNESRLTCLNAARQNPHSHVIGTDLSLIQPPNIPPNCEFIREDSEEEWLFHQKFDYVHLRLVFTCFDYPRRVIAEAFKNMNPGGWIEFQDGSANIQSKGGPFEGEWRLCGELTVIGQLLTCTGMNAGSALQRWSECLISGAGTMGRDIEKAQDYKKWLIEAGCRWMDTHHLCVSWCANCQNSRQCCRGYTDVSLQRVAGGSEAQKGWRVHANEHLQSYPGAQLEDAPRPRYD